MLIKADNHNYNLQRSPSDDRLIWLCFAKTSQKIRKVYELLIISVILHIKSSETLMVLFLTLSGFSAII